MSSTQNVDYQKKDLPGKLRIAGQVLFVIGLLGVAAAYLVDGSRAAFNNIIMLMFLTSIGLGSLFLVAVEYVAGAVWSTPFRRIPEILSSVLLVLPVVVIPLLFKLGDIFHWMHPEVVEADKILKGKAPYLNTEFFIVRVALFMILWIVFYFFITRNSRKQDSSFDQTLTKTNIKLSAAFIPVFGITISFSAFDWLMSLEPHWFSTIFGVYYFSGSILAAFAAVTLIVVWLNENGYLVKGLTNDHYYSLGAFMFAFTNFWAYIAFSQFLLIWYANLPEETFWFLQRWEGNWMYVSIGLIFIRFAIPYFGLLTQPSKMDPKRLMIMSVWLLFAHLYDLYWLAMPNYSKVGALFGWIELAFPMLSIGVVILLFVNLSKKNNLVPVGDPKLKRGIDFRL
ncbi:MAG TPA: quinol:cytochrome C oxidoreductase [Melioribacteraceae bacterium]|nr:quinol:cytochrome C oxidoreductase [Melioribacteraceae bacterium]